MATFNDIWSELQASGKPPPYLLMDCAGVEGGEAQLPKQIFSEIECLFTGDLADELGDVGPYLGRLGSYQPTVARIVEDLLVNKIAVLVIPATKAAGSDRERIELSFSQIHRHFRKFNMVYGPTGKPLFFRYYDPRVLIAALRVLQPGQIDAIFELVSGLVLSNQDNNWVRCDYQSGALVVRT